MLSLQALELRFCRKIALGKTFGYSNDHERDALTAALLTYRSYKIYLPVSKRKHRKIQTLS